jgi:hypothetical protein
MAIKFKGTPSAPVPKRPEVGVPQEKVRRVQGTIEAAGHRVCPHCGHVIEPLSSTERVRRYRARKGEA